MEFYKNEFWLTGNVGNNEFSWIEREKKTIRVGSLVEGRLPLDFSQGDIAFCEKDDDVEYRCKGIKNFQSYVYNGKRVYFFDNHNHTFFFATYEQQKCGYSNLEMVHVDQHKDMRKPKISFEEYKIIDEEYRKKLIAKNTRGFITSYENQNTQLDFAYEYTNILLNVGNYICPLLESEIVKTVHILDSQRTLREPPISSDYFLNLDLDFFSKDMDYICFEEKVERIKVLIGEAKFITVATSPYFIELERCKKAMETLFY